MLPGRLDESRLNDGANCRARARMIAASRERMVSSVARFSSQSARGEANPGFDREQAGRYVRVARRIALRRSTSHVGDTAREWNRERERHRPVGGRFIVRPSRARAARGDLGHALVTAVRRLEPACIRKRSADEAPRLARGSRLQLARQTADGSGDQ